VICLSFMVYQHSSEDALGELHGFSYNRNLASECDN
jgi:hypothetical protein